MQKKINTKKELFISVSIVLVVILTIIYYLAKIGDIEYVLNSIEEDFIENRYVLDSINSWSDGQFKGFPKEEYPFIIQWYRAGETCNVLNGINKYINVGDAEFLKRIYHFYNNSSFESINIYQDVIIYHLNYGTTTIIDKHLYNIKYSLVYFRKKTKRYKNYNLYNRGEIPETKKKWFYRLEANWYIKNYLPVARIPSRGNEARTKSNIEMKNSDEEKKK